MVEDDPDISMSLQDLLEFEGFHVTSVPGTPHAEDQAFSSIEQHVYDAVLLDLGLPHHADAEEESVSPSWRRSNRPILPLLSLS